MIETPPPPAELCGQRPYDWRLTAKDPNGGSCVFLRHHRTRHSWDPRYPAPPDADLVDPGSDLPADHEHAIAPAPGGGECRVCILSKTTTHALAEYPNGHRGPIPLEALEFES